MITDQSHGLPYSKGLMASSLMVSGLAPSEAYRVAERIEGSLAEQEVTEIQSGQLRDLAASMLLEVGEQYSSTYLKWQAVEELDVPLVILLGGATGVGKSTIATRLAVRLGITRVVSTDAIREVFRAAFSKELMPTLHVSSYEADLALSVPVPQRSDPLIIGFQRQVASVAVGIKALISRAIEEGTDILVEGAHVVPGFLDGWEEEFKDAVVVPVVVSVREEWLHRSHFHRRAAETRYRPGDRYLAAFERIRKIQDYITQLAADRGVPVVEMFDLDSTLQSIVTIVVEKALESAQTRGQAPVEIPGLGDGSGPEPPATSTQKQSRPRGWQALTGRRRK